VTQSADARIKPSFRKTALIVIWSLIAVQVAAWLTILILHMNSIGVVIGSIGGNQLQMTLFWTGVGSFMVLIFAAEVTYARDHRGAGITLIALTAIGTLGLTFVALIAISITAYQSFTHFSLEGSGDTYAIDTSRVLFEGGGPSVTVYRTHGPFYDESQRLAEDSLGSSFNPFEDGEYFVMQRGGNVTIRFSQYPGSQKDLSIIFPAAP